MSDLEKILLIKGKKFLFKVETSSRSSDYAKYEELRDEIWGFPEDNLPGTRNMMCENFLHEGCSLFIAVYQEEAGGGFREDRESLVGFSYGFVGVKDKAVAFKSLDNLWFYSQYTGVKTGFQGRSLGILIKEFQRDILLDTFGIHTVTCTYDPLTGVNAHRNVHHFSMEVLEYRAATYGEYGGLLNRADVPTDRFFMSWNLKKPAGRRSHRPEARWEDSRLVVRTEYSNVQGKTRPIELEVAKGIDLELRSDLLFVQIPLNFYIMLRETDVSDPGVRRIPLDWRMRTRQAFTSLLARGYQVIDFRKTTGPKPGNFYILQRSAPP